MTTQTKTQWFRFPFFGGCKYYGNGAEVIGWYSKGEEECTSWRASNVGGVYPSAVAAMIASENVDSNQ